jgi:predicted MPP superfamily phosphohydrolase
MVLIIHLADIHIKNRTRHEEYLKVFEDLYLKIREIDGYKIIVIAGDIMDVGEAITPTATNIFLGLIKNLSKEGDIIMIEGNHDKNKNGSSLSLLEAIIPHLDEEKYKVKFLTRTERNYKKGNINFVLTDMNEPAFQVKKVKNEYNVGIYHGTLYKAITDLNYTFENEEKIKATDFKNYDIVLLGDIHKMQYMNTKKTIAYSGSLIQQNYSETILKHGFLVWNLESKTSYFVEVKNEYCHVKSNYTNNILKLEYEPEELKTLEKKYLNVEIHYERTMEININNKLQEFAEENGFIINSHKPVEIKRELTLNQEEKRNTIIDIYKKIMTEKNEPVDNNVLDEFNIIETNIANNLNKSVKIKKLMFYGVMTYENEYVIDFENIKGMLVITGENGIGKSTIIDMILIMLFNNPSRGKSKDLIKKSEKQKSGGEIYLSVNGTDYKIKRNLSEESPNVGIYKKINEQYEKILSGNKKNTEEKIRQLFGNCVTFSLLSIYLQTGDDILKMKSKISNVDYEITNTGKEEKYDTILHLLNVEQYLKLKEKHTLLRSKKITDIAKLKENKQSMENKILNKTVCEHELNEILVHIEECNKNILPRQKNLILLKNKIENIEYENAKELLEQYGNENYENMLNLEKNELLELEKNYTEKYNCMSHEDIEKLQNQKKTV